ncbi:MAG: hypothetical protein L0Z53_23860 [Acidobacteriales bacterium]|nr:hypothetical protein [Terriglobales bacterium]
MRYWLVLLTLVITSSSVFAQHVEVGGFGSYEAFDQAGQAQFPDHGFGLGGRLGFNMGRYLQLEFETGYDFKHPKFNIASTSTGAILTNSKLGVLHANAGLKLQSPGGSFFFFLKGGANRFDTERDTITIMSFPTVQTLTQSSEHSFTKGVLYPGAGIAFYAGPLGLRIDGGDEIYWDNGAHHNWRFTFGPTIRF